MGQMVTPKEAAHLLGISLKTLRRLVKQGELKVVRYTDGGRYVIPAEEIDRLRTPRRVTA